MRKKEKLENWPQVENDVEEPRIAYIQVLTYVYFSNRANNLSVHLHLLALEVHGARFNVYNATEK